MHRMRLRLPKGRGKCGESCRHSQALVGGAGGVKVGREGGPGQELFGGREGGA